MLIVLRCKGEALRCATRNSNPVSGFLISNLRCSQRNFVDSTYVGLLPNNILPLLAAVSLESSLVSTARNRCPVSMQYLSLRFYMCTDHQSRCDRKSIAFGAISSFTVPSQYSHSTRTVANRLALLLILPASEWLG